MFRFLTIAVLAGGAIPAAAIAQVGPRGDRGFRGARAERTVSDSGARPERAPRADRPQRNFTHAPAAPTVQAQPAAVQTDRSSWRGNRGGNGNRSGWNGNRGGDGQRGWRGNTPATAAPVVAQPQPSQTRDRGIAGALGFDRDRGQRREANRGNDGRRDWNRDDNSRRDWNRNDDRRDWNRNDGRRDWNDRRYDNNGRYDGNRSSRSWDRGWRSDRRYNWQGYRASNRYAYRLPQYYAPRGWSYGYRRFGIGTTLFAGLFAQDYWIGDPYSYRLPPVDWPYRWVRYYDDALLVDTETGQVVDVIPGIFW